VRTVRQVAARQLDRGRQRALRRLAGDDSLRPSPLLAQPLPRFPFPALRRTYQRAMYAYFELQDRH
jgi:hypothetical protein